MQRAGRSRGGGPPGQNLDTTGVSREDQTRLRQYLLGRLTEAEQEEVELRLLTDPDFSEESDIVADELIDQYAHGKIPTAELEQFENYFLRSQVRQDKLSFALALRKRKRHWASKLYRLYLPAAAAAVILIGIGAVVWQALSRQAELDKGLAAFRSAYREQRPVEARLTALAYAPVPQQRGGERVDYVQRSLAEGLLSYAVSESPGAESHHALGQYYLAERQFDKAIDQLKTALSLEPRNAKIHSDLGAALMEQGKADASGGKGVKEFAESLDHLNRALELDGSLLDALFNRALLYRHMTLLPQAEEDWRRYLELDPNSRWADEARQNLDLLHEQRRRTSLGREAILQDFLKARESQDEEAAWRIVSSYHNRTGNVIVEQLLDAYLEPAAAGREADDRLRQLSYVGELVSRRAGDTFYQDLARFYQTTTRAQNATLAEARRLMKRGHESWGQARVEESSEFFGGAKLLFEQAGNVPEAEVAQYWLGFCYHRMNDRKKGRAVLEALASTCESNEHNWVLVRVLYLLSAIQFSVNEHSLAVNFARRSLELAERTQDTVGALNALSALVEYYRYLGNYDKALSYVEQSLPTVSSISLDPIQGCRHYGFVASTFASVGSYAAAAAYQREALRFALSSGVDTAVSSNYAFLGMINGRLGNYSEALTNAGRALEIAQKRAAEPAYQNLSAYAFLQLGNIHRQAGDCERAVANYNRAIELYETLNFQTHLYQAHKGRLLCYVERREDVLAKEEIAAALGLVEKYRTKIFEGNNRDNFFDVEDSVYDVAIDFAYSKLDDARQAFQYAESSRARSLLDLINSDPEIVGEGRETELVLKPVSRPLDLAEIQRRLPENAQILQYAVLEDKLLIWVVSKEKLSHVAVHVTRGELEEKVLGYVRSVSAASGNSGDESAGQAKELYEILIRPAVSFIDPGKEVGLVPDKFLNYLPFGALVSPESGRYVVEDYLLARSPSSSTFILCSEMAHSKSEAKAERLLSVGNPRFDRALFHSLPDLPAAEREAAEVASYYHPATLLLGDRAEVKPVINQMAISNVVHLALHSALDERFPLRSKLVLAKAPAGAADARSAGAVLYAHEIYDMRLPQTRLVVLSACQTGAERYYKGEGMINMARPYIAAGVPLVVASLWPVDSEATAELMTGFHRYRKREGFSTGEALRRAQIDMLRRPDGRFRQPYYWAPFTVIGGHAKF